MPSCRNLSRRSAFTLIELLVVVTIIGILAALILPLMARLQVRGYETKTMSNMRAMGTALMTYAGDNSYQLPSRPPAQTDGTVADKWPVTLFPYLQDLSIYGSPVPDTGGKTYKVTDQKLYLSNSTNYTTYIYNGGNDVSPYNSGAPLPRLNIIQRPVQTILLGIPLPQKNNYYMDFAEGNNKDVLNLAAFGDGTPYIFCDGSARVLQVDPKVDNKAEPASSGTYTDWLWLFDKSAVGNIQ